MSEAPKLLELEGVSFVDGDHTVLDTVDLFVREGEVVGVSFAQAHAGKTTLLYIAAGLRAPSSGTVRLAGERIEAEGPTPEQPPMGMVFRDDGGLFPNLNLLENVALPLRYHDVPEDESDDRALAALTEVGLATAAERYPWELTRERQRLTSLARALVYEPRLVLIDDFFAGADEAAFDLSVRVIQSAKEERGTAFLLIVEAGEDAYLDRSVRIDNGHVV